MLLKPLLETPLKMQMCIKKVVGKTVARASENEIVSHVKFI
jgi:hypothetical protein